jgi:hypothetical protein
MKSTTVLPPPPPPPVRSESETWHSQHNTNQNSAAMEAAAAAAAQQRQQQAEAALQQAKLQWDAMRDEQNKMLVALQQSIGRDTSIVSVVTLFYLSLVLFWGAYTHTLVVRVP